MFLHLMEVQPWLLSKVFEHVLSIAFYFFELLKSFGLTKSEEATLLNFLQTPKRYGDHSAKEREYHTQTVLVELFHFLLYFFILI